jgi:AraC family transcriptional regulator, melibiose operon regulatory protein
VVTYEAHEAGFELAICQTLLIIWNTLYSNVWSAIPSDPSVQYKEIERLRKTITYLQEHYHEHVTLSAIAEHVNICTSECCRFFKRHMNQTIFEYLLEYRIEKSLPLLIRGEDSITAIAQAVGFSNPAYFGKVFHQVMRCSPSDYRKSFISKTQKV